MIRYALQCEAAHAFDSWFRDSDAFDAQVSAGQLNCPICGSRSIVKQIMAPAVAVHDQEPQPVVAPGSKDHEIRAILRAFRQHLEANAENVGAEFADEARKIHYGETDERAIYGVTSPDEARALGEEGIEVLPVPVLPDDLN